MQAIKHFVSQLSGTSPEQVKAVQGEIDAFIADNRVAVFSKSWCPYCSRAKGILDSEHIQYKSIDMDLHADGRAIQKSLAQRAHRSQVTVPQIYINGKLIGGSDELARAQADGSLAHWLSQSQTNQAQVA